MHAERSGDIEHWPDGGWLVHNITGVNWSPSNCQGTAKDPHTGANCNHMAYWPYTRLDGFMAMAMQQPDKLEDAKTVVNKVAASVKEYMSGTAAKWYVDYAKAYAKMMSVGESAAHVTFHVDFMLCVTCGTTWLQWPSLIIHVRLLYLDCFV
jgi:hypothetical protein